MEVLTKMIVSNWRFHSQKYNKRTLKPQALRQSKRRLKSLIRKLNANENRSQQN